MTEYELMVSGLVYSARKKTKAPSIHKNMLAVIIILVSRVKWVNRLFL